jgi:hypothetical protein
VIVTALVAVFTAAMHAPVLLRPPTNADELIYLRLALSMTEGTGYTLQGSRILSSLPPEMYDHALFNHPPGFPWLLMPMVAAGFARWTVVISLAAHLGCAAAVAFLGYRFLLRDDDSLWRRMLFCIVSFAAFMDPILSFCSRRVWMDNVLAAWIAWAFVGVFLLRSSKPFAALLLASACMAAAVGTKLLMIVFLPPMALAVFLLSPGTVGVPPASSAQSTPGSSTPTTKAQVRNLLLFVIPTLLVLGIWEGIFLRSTGEWFPKWLAIPTDVLASKEFLALRQDQPFLYFPAKFVLLSPLAALVLPAALYLLIRNPPTSENASELPSSQLPSPGVSWLTGKSRTSPQPVLIFPLLAIFLYLTTLVILGTLGFSKEARYLAPVMPLLSMSLVGVFGFLANDGGRSHALKPQLFVFACLLAILSGAMLAGFYLFAIQFDEPLSWWGLIDSVMENL